MATCLDISNWRASTPAETIKFLELESPKGDVLIVRTHLKPVDVYSYLVARFGRPNGIHEALRSDSSDNWIHWDFLLKAGEQYVHLSGTSREVHILISEQLSDEGWKAFILAIKADFKRVGKEKSAVFQRFEKFAVFQNKFVAIANLCADLHAQIVDTPPSPKVPRTLESEGDIAKHHTVVQEIGTRGDKLFGDSLKLQLLTPIMAEAFLNMLILTFCKSGIRNNREAYDAFLRETIPERLDLLSKNCVGFTRPIDKTTAAYADFMRVVAKRNFALHGNVDPVRETMEIVYFDGKRPLFTTPGHHIEKMFEHLDALYKPYDAATEYENVHAFLIEIQQCLDEGHRTFFEGVISDAYPAYELTKKGVTRIFPDQVMMAIMPAMRYDDLLAVEW